MGDFAIDTSSATDVVPLPWLRRVGRQLLHNHLIFDFGAWGYAWMTGNPIWRANCARLLEAVPLADNKLQVLDLGAGPGNSALAMGEQRPEARFIAFDLAQQMLQLANGQRIVAGWSQQRLAPVRGDALRLPFADATVDVVTGHSFLYLLPDYTGVLAEAYRVLRPGGYVAFLEPHAGAVDWRWLLRQRSAGLQISVSLWRFYSWLHRRFSPERLQIVLAEAGFYAIRMEVTLGGFGIFGRGQKP
jgi:ubiquinone/menaquinone biosynthesis C-methylase UbiE